VTAGARDAILIDNPTHKELAMPTSQNNETKATAAQPPRSSAPDGKSGLPDVLPDFPNPGNGDSGPSSGTMLK